MQRRSALRERLHVAIRRRGYSPRTKKSYAQWIRRFIAFVGGQHPHAVLAQMHGKYRLLAELLYGSGLRSIECWRLRVHDLDLQYAEITVRAGRGGKDRRTLLPHRLAPALERQIERVQRLRELDLSRGVDGVTLPYTLSRKFPRAPSELGWWLVFPASAVVRDGDSAQLATRSRRTCSRTATTSGGISFARSIARHRASKRRRPSLRSKPGSTAARWSGSTIHLPSSRPTKLSTALEINHNTGVD